MVTATRHLKEGKVYSAVLVVLGRGCSLVISHWPYWQWDSEGLFSILHEKKKTWDVIVSKDMDIFFRCPLFLQKCPIIFVEKNHETIPLCPSDSLVETQEQNETCQVSSERKLSTTFLREFVPEYFKLETKRDSIATMCP